MGQKDRMLKGIGAREIGYPYHTNTREERSRYHNRSDCGDGRTIKQEDIRSGQGGSGRTLCKECEKLGQAATTPAPRKAPSAPRQ